jgi:cell division protein ZapE
MPLARLERRIAGGELEPDPRQRAAMERLDRLARELRATAPPAPRPRGLLGRLGRGAAPPAPRGVYLHGDVGRGKSMLMDLFLEAAPITAKRRVHFHAFMLEVQRRLAELRRQGNLGDPLGAIAGEIAATTRLLCFDELQVTDIADAMILGRLFEALLAAGVVLVATSNWPPGRLYEGGLNRDRFLPFIELLLARLDVVALDGPVDYRLRRLEGVPVYLAPLGPETEARLARILTVLTDGMPLRPETLEVQGRRLEVPRAAGGLAAFPFRALCERPLGAADYLALTERYHSLVLEGVPVLSPDRRNEARRLVTLVDALYERRVMLILTAEAEPERLYPEGDGAFEFRRTVSRLIEMQSRDWLERCRDRRPADLPASFAPFALTSDLG